MIHKALHHTFSAHSAHPTSSPIMLLGETLLSCFNINMSASMSDDVNVDDDTIQLTAQ